VRGLEPALVLAALALSLHGAYRFASGGPDVRLTALFDIALAAVAASAVFFWREGKPPSSAGERAEGGEAGPDKARSDGRDRDDPSPPSPPSPPDPVRDFLFYAVPALGAAAVLWFLTR